MSAGRKISPRLIMVWRGFNQIQDMEGQRWSKQTCWTRRTTRTAT